MRTIKKVLTTVDYTEDNLKSLRELFEGSQFVHCEVKDTLGISEALKDADVAILQGDIDSRFLGENQLKWIHCDHAGLSNSAKPEIFDRKILLTGSSGRSAPVLAEHCIYFMLQSCYHTRELLCAQKMRQWGVQGMEQWRGLFGRTAGIIGMGNNGRMLAERLHAMGMNLITYDRQVHKEFDYIQRQLDASRGDGLDELLEKSDFIILCIALTDQTYHLIDRNAFEKMKHGVTIVNIARGQLIDTEALLSALVEGKVGCAGLDVFEEEPLPSDHALWEKENVYITPHVTPQVPDRTGRSLAIIAENVRRYKEELPLLNEVKRQDIFQKV